MSNRLVPAHPILLTDYTQAEEDTFAATLTGKEFGWALLFNTTITPAPGIIRVWNGTAFESTPAIPPSILALATASVQGAIPAFGSALQVMRVNAGGTALEFVTLAGGGDMLKSENLSGLINYVTARANMGLIIGTDVLAPAGNGSALTGLTKSQVGLGNVDNTSDLTKPISTATQVALDLLQVILLSGTNIKTINGSSVLGAGDLVVSGATSATETEIDFGTTPVSEKLFTITDATINTSKKIMCTVSYAAPTGKDQDELEMDDLQLRAVAGTGNFALYVRAADGSYLADKFKIYYIIAS